MVVKMIGKSSPRAEKKASGVTLVTSKRRFQKQAEIVTNTSNGAEEKAILVAKELKFVKTLAGNDPKLRRKVLKNLKIWLATRSRSTFSFTDTDFLRLWKGLFYCMWMSDKPLIQESLADEIASLVRCFDQLSVALKYFGAFLQTMCNEWFGIDHWRMDKFMMLVRRCTRQMLLVLHESNWPESNVREMMEHVEKTILNADVCTFGLTKHFNDLILEELAKVSEGEVDPTIVHIFLKSYAQALISTNDMRLIKQITSSIFHSLLYQSALGQDYQEKFDLWKKNNFVTGNIDDVDFDVMYEDDDQEEDVVDDAIESDDEESDTQEKIYDPRAGQVDVVINEIQFDPLKVIEMLECDRFKTTSTSKGKKHMKMLVKQYKKYAAGLFPLGVQSVESIDKKDYAVDLDEQIKEIDEYEKELFGDKIDKKKKKKDNKKASVVQSSEETTTLSENNEKHTSDKKSGSKKKKKKLTRAQLKEEKLKQLTLKREAKLKDLKEQKQAKLTKKSKTTVEIKTKIKKSSNVEKSDNVTDTPPAVSNNVSVQTFAVQDDWSQPLKEGENEYFVPSRKSKLQEANQSLKEEDNGKTLVKNPFATPKNSARALKRVLGTANTVGNSATKKKRVQIALNKNISQELQQHIQQVKSSPQLPYDSNKKPAKGVLKQNLMPSPINPFYRKKIGLRLNETL
ncbi:ribosomal RNA processing protein 1 homolog [Uranotaenia lowii]|uniref:ribosomal RNA processing protein 1 homolog n=1 Tax=Uranotaenia lowii TaxID=190385 RepID=UPI00247AC267|nr:ribosomal RNA processing protein 1 homolog [Uranotaenia lowii]